MSNFVIGIDLGTTNSCTSIFYKGRMKLLENAEGARVTPSFVFFIDALKETSIVGPYAKKMSDQKPEFGIYEFKRLIGKDFVDTNVQNHLQYYPFGIEVGGDGKCVITIQQKDKTIKKTVEEISAILLQKLKKDVSAKLKSAVDKAVITVPAYFNSEQRQATLKAAKLAGFTVLKLLNEPTAAALSYFHEKELTTSGLYYLVYDFGGGTFDVAILKKNQEEIEIVAVDGDTHLGGGDFDVLITNYICSYLLKENNFDASKNKRIMKRLQTKSEKAKKSLSFVEETEIILEGFVTGQDVITISFTRKQFEEMASPLIKKSIDILEMCLKSAQLQNEQIEEVILSGGSTRIPLIEKMLTHFFNGKDLEKLMNPDECVASGAAIQAALLSTNSEQTIQNITIKDVTPLSLTGSDWTHRVDVIIKRNTAIPASGKFSYSPLCDYSTDYSERISMNMEIFEGERTDARKNRLLGSFRITNLTPVAPPGKCLVTLTLDLDHNGILTATASEKFRNNVKQLKIDYTRGQRSEGEIKNSVKDAEDNKEEDEAFENFANKKDYLHTYCVRCKYNMENKNLIESYTSNYELCERMFQKSIHLEVADLQYLEELINEIEEKTKQMITFYNFRYMPKKDF